MNDKELIQLAEKIARIAHAGQYRRDGVTPYIRHVEAVVSRLAPSSAARIIAAAWLHDVMEDSGFSADVLTERGIPLDVVEIVTLLTRFEGESYESYLTGIALSSDAVEVKIADMLSNLADEPTIKQVIKYSKALIFLLG